MLDPKDIRIGNIVMVGSNVAIVQEIMASGITYDLFDGSGVALHAEWNYVSAAKLTPEMFEKLGATPTWKSNCLILKSNQSEFSVVQSVTNHKTIALRFDVDVIDTYFDTVHHLQNTWKDLTKTDLTLKE